MEQETLTLDIKRRAVEEFWNQRPPHLNPQFEGKEEYNKGWNACIDFFYQEYLDFINDNKQIKEDAGDNNE